MPSLIPGYEYDIFISYRQNDNRSGASAGSGQGWVTEFVKVLEEELAATIKDPVSVYFDSNPHDGLLETHSVDKSLKEKLRCFIFIPILSQTYCDPKSFAWQHEFCAFNRLAKEDPRGLDIKLSNGNVASRILPVKVHDLDAQDKAMIERETGGALRAIDFISKSAGVNRPLSPKDDEVRTHGKVLYRDQVNKVANAVKEIIMASKAPTTGDSAPTVEDRPPRTPRWSKRAKIIVAVMAFLALSVYQFVNTSSDRVVTKSIAILPFTDMSPDKDQEYLGDGLAEEIINVLAQSNELKVIARTSSFQFKGKTEDLRVVGEKLGVATVLEGSVRKSGETLRITAQLIETESGTHLWSQTFDRKLEDILKVQDEIARAVASALKGKLLGKKEEHQRNPEVHNLTLRARHLVRNREKRYYQKADSLYQIALSIDSADAMLWADIAILNNVSSSWGPIPPLESLSRARKAAARALALDENLTEARLAMAYIRRNQDKDWAGAAEEYRAILGVDPNNVSALASMGSMERNLGHLKSANQYLRAAIKLDPMDAGRLDGFGLTLLCSDSLEQAIPYLRRALEIQPTRGYTHAIIGIILTNLKKFDEAKKEFDVEPSPSWKLFGQTLYAHAIGDVAESNKRLAELKARFGGPLAYQIAAVHGVRGEVDSAYHWLNNAMKVGDVGLTFTKIDPMMKKLNSDPRWKPLLAKLGFPED